MKTPKEYKNVTRREVIGTLKLKDYQSGSIREMKIRFKSIRAFCKWAMGHRVRNAATIVLTSIYGDYYGTLALNRDNVSLVIKPNNIYTAAVLVKVNDDSMGWMDISGVEEQ